MTQENKEIETIPVEKDNVEGYVKMNTAVTVDADTGMICPMNVNDLDKGKIDTDIDGIENSDKLFDDVILSDKTKDTLKDFDLSDSEASELMNLLLDVKSGNDKHLFSRLPQKLKSVVGGMVGTNSISALNSASKDLIRMFVNEMKIDQGYIDLNSAIEKELGSLDEIGDMYKEYDNERMDKSMLVLYEKYKDSNPEKAKKFIELRDIFLDASSFKTIREALENNVKETNRLDKGLKRYERICDEFNYKYKNSKFNINSVKLIAKTLKRVFADKYDEDTICKFTILFCRICMNKDANNVDDHAYMFYTIKTILLLDILIVDKPNYIEISTNIEKILELINKKYEEEKGCLTKK